MIPASVRIFVCTEPQDLRKSFDGLALAAQQVLGEDPQSGALFCFANKRMNRLKVVWWDRNGYCLLYKRLEKQRFPWPRREHEGVVQMAGRELNPLLDGIGLLRVEPHEALSYTSAA